MQSSKIHLPPVLSGAFLVVYRLGGAGPRGQALRRQSRANQARRSLRLLRWLLLGLAKKP